MSDLKRQILEDVKGGRLSPGEAATRLEELERGPQAPDTPRAPEPPQGAVRRIKLLGDFRTFTVIGDASVAGASVEGTHAARREGDTLIVDAQTQPTEQGEGEFVFERAGRKRIVIGLGQRPRTVVVKMNPDLPLDVSLNAGSLTVTGVRAPITADVDAGAIRIDGTESPFDISSDAGSITVSALLRTGDARIRCEAGAVKVRLRHGSSVKVHAASDVGAIKLGNAAGRGFRIGGQAEEVAFGDGDARLRISTAVGKILVEEEA